MQTSPESKFTPGPWAWFGNAHTNYVYLATVHSGRRFVMDFVRWGFRGAQPRFQPSKRGMVEAKDLLQFEVGDRSVVGVSDAKENDSVYRLDIRGIDCADAHLIAAAPCMYEALKVLEDHYRKFLDWLGPCDHDAGVCTCKERRALDTALGALSRAEGKE